MSLRKDLAIIPEYPDYNVDAHGNVFNKHGKKLKPYPDRNGYLQVKLHGSEKPKACLVHRLVASAFLEQDSNQSRTEINHIDGDKSNNRIDNLEYCTRSENMKHALNTGLKKIRYFSYEERQRAYKTLIRRNSRPVRIVETGEEFSSSIDCERKTGCFHSAVLNCCKNSNRTHHGYHFEFVDKGAK